MKNDLQSKGYTKVRTGPGGEAWVRLAKRGNWVIGSCVIISEDIAFSFGAAACLSLATMEATAAVASSPPAVVAGLVSNFKRRINRAAKKIAKMKVLNKLRRSYMKVIQGPIGDLGIAAGARALSAFGLPAAATRVALTQRRNATADRLAHGGWAGMVATATEKGGAQKLAKQILERNKRAAIDAIPAALPGGGLAQAAKGLAGQLTTGYDPDTMRDTYILGLYA